MSCHIVIGSRPKIPLIISASLPFHLNIDYPLPAVKRATDTSRILERVCNAVELPGWFHVTWDVLMYLCNDVFVLQGTGTNQQTHNHSAGLRTSS